MSYADRVESAWEKRDRDLWDEHERGEHAAPVRECARCRKDAREAPDSSWTEGPDGYVRAPLENRGTL